jgi:hypothetical protein
VRGGFARALRYNCRRVPLERTPGWPVLAVALAAAPLGCIAHVQEQRDFGAARPAPDAEVTTSRETRPAPARIEATAHGASLDVRVVRSTECRSVTHMTSTIREVDVRRSFTDPRPQEWDVAAMLLLGGAAGFLAYDADGPWACNSSASSCSGAVGQGVKPVAFGLGFLAAVPLAFVAYNAVRAQDDRYLERTGPTEELGTWEECGTAPASGEPVSVAVGSATLHATTGADGRATFDLSALVGAGATRAVVRHAGSDDLTVEALGGTTP